MADRKKTLPVIIGGLIMAAVASYFGIDTLQESSQQSAVAAAETTTTADATARAATGTQHRNRSGNASSAAPTYTKNQTANKGFEKFRECQVDSLPKEAMNTIDDILAGGPYEYPENDNKRFGNHEKQLPDIGRNYYREYTVDTPGLNHRGTRRIVTGGGSETDPDVWLYTQDHYQSFCVIPDAEK